MKIETRQFIIDEFNSLRAEINRIGCDILERLLEDEE